MTIQEYLKDGVYYAADGIAIYTNGDFKYIADIRGWGGICNMFKDDKVASDFQDSVGQFIADAINEKLTATSKVAELEKEIVKLRKEMAELVVMHDLLLDGETENDTEMYEIPNCPYNVVKYSDGTFGVKVKDGDDKRAVDILVAICGAVYGNSLGAFNDAINAAYIYSVTNKEG
jgi:hypothetical protein